jgi:GH15 family glucan-1,4-alpha-glucosidase
MRRTVAAIEQQLNVNGYVLRYHTSETNDGLPAGEGAFLACSFWLVDNLVLQNRIEEARRLFDQLLSVRNDVGLLAEEYDPIQRRQLGNFPQALSHLALIGSALNFARGERPIEQRPGNPDPVVSEPAL